jgi:CcmD family protein
VTGIDSSNLTFIIAAYSVSWLVILGYLGHLIRKSSRVRAEYDRAAGGQGGEAQ